MSEKRKEYIDRLLRDLKLLEESLLSVKESDTLPFSFFSASFDRVEKISRSLHELEMLQVGEMKVQMERLVRFLSESERQTAPVSQTEYSSTEEVKEEITEIRQEAPAPEPEVEEVTFVERVILPEYKNPRAAEPVPSAYTGTGELLSEKNGAEKPAARSLNDIIQVPPALLDLKRGISLNDRFLFQRELFNNNREEMNRVMDSLSALANFEEAERYLQDEQGWNFEGQTVKEFLLVIKKGFE